MIIDYQLNDIDVNVYKVNIFYIVNVVDMEYDVNPLIDNDDLVNLMYIS